MDRPEYAGGMTSTSGESAASATHKNIDAESYRGAASTTFTDNRVVSPRLP